MHAIAAAVRLAERVHVKGTSWDKVKPQRLVFVCDHGECQFCDNPEPLGKTHVLEIDRNVGFVACTQCKSMADKRWSMSCEVETWNKYVQPWMDMKDASLTVAKLDDWDQVAGQDKKQPTTEWVFGTHKYMRRGSAAGSAEKQTDLYASVLHKGVGMSSWVLWTKLCEWNPKLLMI